MSYYAGASFLGPEYGWQEQNVNKVDDKYLAYLAGKLNDVSRSTKNNGRALLQEYMASLNVQNGETQTPDDWENLNKLSKWYAGTKDGRGTTLESFQSQYGKEFGTWKNAGSVESQGHVAAYGSPGSNGMLGAGQSQDSQGQTQSQYPAMPNEYNLGNQSQNQLNSQATTAPAAGTTNQSMGQQSGGQPVAPSQPLTQQAGSESSRGFNPWSLIGESIARSR